MLVSLNRKEEAEKIYRELFDRNSNSDNYLQEIFKCNNINLGILYYILNKIEC